MSILTWRWWLGISSAAAVERWGWDWAAGGRRRIFVLLLALLAVALLAWFFAHRQRQYRVSQRVALALLRGLAVLTIIAAMASPVVRAVATRQKPPAIVLLLDGTRSMLLQDRNAAPDEPAPAAHNIQHHQAGHSRLATARSWLEHPGGLIAQLVQRGVEVDAYVFDGAAQSRLRALPDELDGDEASDAVRSMAKRWEATGDVTSLEAVLEDLSRIPGASDAAGILVVSDFANNSGPAPVGAEAAIGSLAAPLFAIGVGATSAADAAVEIMTDAKWKRGEASRISVMLNQEGLAGGASMLAVWDRPLQADGSVEQRVLVDERRIVLDQPHMQVDLQYAPSLAGMHVLEAELAPLEPELNTENNRSAREVRVVDDFLRLMYVAHDPNWEWRFIKEVFHRDPLVGIAGFRTFLASSDPQVRRGNPLFLETPTLQRKEFLAQDVLFLGDVPSAAVTNRFAAMVRELVAVHGAGLVVISGPRFGPAQLLDTPLAEMLPVVPARQARLLDDRPYVMQRTPSAERYSFMQLADDPRTSEAAWENMGELPWLRPVIGLHEQAIALAEHPRLLCDDGVTRQPLIAVRPFGKGEVVYLGFDEMFRLRRGIGERYYRRFWSQLIYRLGMSHALGPEKRFRFELSSPQALVRQSVTLTIECYDADFEPLQADAVPDAALEVRMRHTAQAEDATLTAAWVRPGVFQAVFEPEVAGRFVFSVSDPVTQRLVQQVCDVQAIDAELGQLKRNVTLQEAMAREGRGEAVELADANLLLDRLSLRPTRESQLLEQPLWRTPLWFALVISACAIEWTLRRWWRGAC